ncbi:hypothetical protein FRC02_000816 [Tulasnella sp. 418]|nr:hypothetical protein FRC02_000816 [Tulasnella sp. 418]
MDSISNLEATSSPADQQRISPATSFSSSSSAASQARSRSIIHPFRIGDFRSSSSAALDLARQLSLQIEESIGRIGSTRKLVGHSSCINALTWSSGSDGKWMASGGDDNKILLWDMYGDFEAPIASCQGPRGNIFTIAFNASNTTLFTADGQIVQHDTRAQSNFSTRCIDHNCEINDVKYHPLTHDLFISCDENGGVWLHDARQAFSSATSANNTFVQSNGISNVSMERRGVVQKYVNLITKPGYTGLCRPEASSIAVDAEGDRFAVTFLQHLPTIYSINDPYPVATVSGKHLPDGSSIPVGERTYNNSSTTKHGSFSPLGTHYVAGSDDFRSYVWHIPSNEWLLERRRKMTEADWLEEGNPNFEGPLIGYARDLVDVPVVPFELSTPSCRLGASSEDEKAIALFDEILRQEGNRDVFVTRPFAQGRQARNGLSFMGDGSSYYGVDPDSDSD